MLPSLFLTAFILPLLLQVQPKEELRFRFIPKQQHETSCGLAAAAGALSLYWHIPVTEKELVLSFFGDKRPGKERISLATLKEILETWGVSSRGFWIPARKLCSLTDHFSPLLVYFSKPEPHFALLLGEAEGVWILADPAEGTIFLSQREFEQRYGEAVLLMHPLGKTGNSTFAERAKKDTLGRFHILEQLLWEF